MEKRIYCYASILLRRSPAEIAEKGMSVFLHKKSGCDIQRPHECPMLRNHIKTLFIIADQKAKGAN